MWGRLIACRLHNHRFHQAIPGRPRKNAIQTQPATLQAVAGSHPSVRSRPERVITSISRSTAFRRAVDISWALSGPEFYTLFIRKREWTPIQFSDYLYQMAVEQLLSSPARRRH